MRSRVPMGLYRAFFFLFSLSLSLSLFRSSIARDTLKGLVRGSLLPFESESCREKKKKRFLFFSHRFSFDDSFPSFRSSLLFSRHDENFEKVNGKWENSARCKTFQYSPSVNRNILGASKDYYALDS